MFEIMKCIAEGIAAHGVKGLLEMAPGGKYVHDVGAYAAKRYREKKNQKKLEEAVKEVIVKKAGEALEEAKKAVEAVVPQLGAREKELVAQYLAGLPEAARQSLRRKDDPTGTSLPFGFTLHEPQELAQLLPQHPPRFATGEWVPGRENNWRLERRLGGGGFGEVWLARHGFKASEKPRAVKFCTDPVAMHQLVHHEWAVVARVMKHADGHPNIVPLLECHLSGNAPWLMYEFVEGGTLAGAIVAWQALPPADRLARAVETLSAVAGAVGHCHAQSPAIVHRDLKPANILMQGDVPRVTDFGIGGVATGYLLAEEKTRGAATLAGRLPSLLSGSYSLVYSSPQQRNRERPDPRDDVHALGVIAYQMLVGRVDAEVKGNWAKRLKTDGVPDALVDLIGASASDEADDRPKDAREWAAALESLRATKSVRTPAATAPAVPKVAGLAPRPVRGEEGQANPAPMPRPAPPPPRQSPVATGGTSLDDIKKRFVNEIKLRASADKYLDRNEEREVFQLSAQLGITIDSARAALGQVCDEFGYVMESRLLKQIGDQLATTNGPVSQQDFDRIFASTRRALGGRKTDYEIKKLIVQVMEATGHNKVRAGWFTDWYAALKKELMV